MQRLTPEDLGFAGRFRRRAEVAAGRAEEAESNPHSCRFGQESLECFKSVTRLGTSRTHTYDLLEKYKSPRTSK